MDLHKSACLMIIFLESILFSTLIVFRFLRGKRHSVDSSQTQRVSEIAKQSLRLRVSMDLVDPPQAQKASAIARARRFRASATESSAFSVNMTNP